MAKAARRSEAVQYTLRYADTWRIAVSGGYRPKQVSNSPADKRVVEAFRAFGQRFYPLLDDNQMPWTAHERGRLMSSGVAATGEWPLGWYWQLVLPALRDQQPVKGSEFKIRLSQVGRYTLLCVLGESGDGERLLCPPVFGHDERLSRGDQYLLYTAVFGADIAKEYDHIKSLQLPAQAEEEEMAYLLGRHDVQYDIRVETTKADRFQVRVKGHFEPHPFIRHLDKYTLDPRKAGGNARTVLPVKNPYCVVQIPRFANLDSDREPAEILLASESVCKAMERLSEVWNDPTCHAVLLVADPGSGKELYARSVYDFRDYRAGGRFCTVTLTENVDRNATVLFAVPSEVHCKHCADKQNDVGAVVRASDGALFVDEVDKVDNSKEVLSPLLRLLEAEEFIAPGTARVVNFKSLGANPPLYVFAASSPGDRVRAMPPQDFWTRISHVIEIDHPLRADPPVRKKILKDYVTLFWNQHVPKLLKARGFCASAAEGRERGAFRKYYPDVAGFLLDDGVVRDLVSCVVELIEAYWEAVMTRRAAAETKPADKEAKLSIRDVRNLTRRCVYQIVQMTLTNDWIGSARRRLDYERALRNKKPLAKVTSVFQWVKTKLKDPAFLEETKDALKASILGTDLGEGKPVGRRIKKARQKTSKKKAG